MHLSQGSHAPNLQVTVMCLVEPGAFREMHSFVQKSCEGSGRLEVISLAATGDLACCASSED